MEHLLNTYALYVMLLGTFFLVVFATISLKKKTLSADLKKFLFIGIVLSAVIPTLVMSVTTVYLNIISSSGGPVHWHADFEVWQCGRELDLKDPTGFSNKIGTATLHEHNDKKIHLEGLVMELIDASLGEFFHVVGGHISPTSFSMPTNDGFVFLENGNSCEEYTGEVQVFLFQTDDDGYYTQQKLTEPEDHIIAPESAVPPGDCIIIEFDRPKERTEKLCEQYEVSLDPRIGKLKGERR